MRKMFFLLASIFALSCEIHAQQVNVERLPVDQFDVLSPVDRVSGAPGQMQLTERSCQSYTRDDIRRRIVNVAVQEWGFFGFPVLDETNIVESNRPRRRNWRRFSWLDPAESARVAHSIAGYWSATPDGRWILSRQNDIWNGSDGIAARWRDPWSAAFVSWVMCESGLDERSEFRHAIAHHTYIDHAIEALDTGNVDAAFVAYEVGSKPVEPGDLLCFSRRPRYQSVAERRLKLGEGIRSHCDIAVKVEPDKSRILAIGGNVRGAVRMKLLPAVFDRNGAEHGAVASVSTGRRAIFAHLKLRADSVPVDTFDNSPTLQAASDRDDVQMWLRQQLEGEKPAGNDATSSSVSTTPSASTLR